MPNGQTINDERYSLHITEHGDQYTNLLKFYIKNVRISNILKIVFKILFFIIIASIMVMLSIFFGYSIHMTFKAIDSLDTLQNHVAESIIGMTGILISSFTTLLVSIIKLPEIIAKYLFNKKEEEHMARIIENIQAYDIQIYSIEKEIKDFLKKQKNEVNSDESPPRVLQGSIEVPGNNDSIEDDISSVE